MRQKSRGSVTAGMGFVAARSGASHLSAATCWRVREIRAKRDGYDYVVLVSDEDPTQLKTLALGALLDRSLFRPLQ